MSQKKSPSSVSSRGSAKKQIEQSEINNANANTKRKNSSLCEQEQQGQIMQLLCAAESLSKNKKTNQLDVPASRGEPRQRIAGKHSSSGHHSFPSQSVVDKTTASCANSLRRRDGFFMFSLAMHEHIRRKMKGDVTHEM